MFHDLDPDSNEFYKVAREYAICNDFVYVSESCEIEIKVIRALVKDQRFLDLVEEITKSFNGKDPYELKKESSRLRILAENERVALSRAKADEKHKMTAITNSLVMNKDLPKGSSGKIEQKGTTVKLQIGEEVYNDTDEFGEKIKDIK